MFTGEPGVGETFKCALFADGVAHGVAEEVGRVGQGELAGGVGFAGDEGDAVVICLQRRREGSGAAADDESVFRCGGFEGEEVEREIGFDADVMLEQRQFGLQEPGYAGACDADGFLVDRMQRGGQEFFKRPEVAGGVDPAGFAGDNVDGERARIGEGQFRMNHENHFAVLAVEIHVEPGGESRGIDGDGLGASVDVQWFARVNAEQVEEVGHAEVEAALGRAFGDILEHKEDVLVLLAHEIGRVGIEFIEEDDAPFDFGGADDGDFAAAILLGPIPREDDVELCRDAAGRVAPDALDVHGIVGGGEPRGPAHFLLRLALAFGVGVAANQGEAEGDDMAADDAALGAVGTGALVVGRAVGHQFELAGEPAHAVGEFAADERMLILDLEHATIVEQELAAAKHIRPGPVHQHLLCDRYPHG